jgi:hypothetical protein
VVQLVEARRYNERVWGRLGCRSQLKCDDTRAETRFRLSAKRTSPFKSAGASVQSTTGSRGVSISGSNAGYTTFRGSVKSTGYSLHSPVSPSLPLPCVTVCHHVSTGVYLAAEVCNLHNHRYKSPKRQLSTWWRKKVPPKLVILTPKLTEKEVCLLNP